ncbi:MAG: hypothetical protein JO296_17955 [Pseudonocardiales bacterium]|nr:hypothetical protein [Pseudonocardiales bacterium]MBV9652003.1 hypothetical protein [Pseudonocardiales bacterium]
MGVVPAGVGGVVGMGVVPAGVAGRVVAVVVPVGIGAVVPARVGASFAMFGPACVYT